VYTVYVHLNQANGEVVHSNCTCTAGKGGQCKHVVALLFQVIEYKQLDMTEICVTLLAHSYYSNGMYQGKMNMTNLFFTRTWHLKRPHMKKMLLVKRGKTSNNLIKPQIYMTLFHILHRILQNLKYKSWLML
jgi:hypothetical protein